MFKKNVANYLGFSECDKFAYSGESQDRLLASLCCIVYDGIVVNRVTLLKYMVEAELMQEYGYTGFLVSYPRLYENMSSK